MSLLLLAYDGNFDVCCFCPTLIPSIVFPKTVGVVLKRLLLRRTIVNRTYVTHKNLYIYLFLLSIFGLIYYAPP